MNSQELQVELEALLRRSPQEVQVWESAEFDRQALAPDAPIVLFGAGGLGKKTLQGLRQLGIEPLCFADNNTALHGRVIEGVTVLPPHEAMQRYSRTATFIVTIWGGHSPDRMNDRMKFLRDADCSHVVNFYPLFCKYPQAFLPHYACDTPHLVYENEEAVLAAGALWSDAASRREYLGQLKWRAQMDFAFFPAPVSHEIYFPQDLCPLRRDETFVDCGAFDGDTARRFLEVLQNKFRKIFAFEPDPQNFGQLSHWRSTQPEMIKRKIEVTPYAISDIEDTLRFCADGTEASSLGAAGSIEVQTITLDHYFAATPITYLKMDIEGAEPSAIHGAVKVIQRDRPVLAVCVYHQQDHIWVIPNLLNSICENYRFYLRPHLLEGWDTVLYAVPAERSA